jgi:hypothetical protein
MAPRWASVGCCENAGIAVASDAVAISAHSAAARPDLSIM